MGTVNPARLVLLAALLLPAGGCTSRPTALNPVRGRVFYRGTILTRGTVVFTPDASRGNRGELARAAIQPDGTYSLRSTAGYGASAGWYRVTVMAFDLPARPEEGQHFAVPHSLVPEKYRDPELAGLGRQVQDGQSNDIDLYLD